ncbi:MAG: carboxylating nicotinate-nucleotide diphosphorylase [Sedimentisphaerales bacterium]|nr:carboxylating nicotinate-nucleotide diphosphorylase [Sedimentisphaerales bacterium]
MRHPERDSYFPLIELARAEDLGGGDLTSEILIPENRQGHAKIVFREKGVLCGITVARDVLVYYDRHLSLDQQAADGTFVNAGQAVGEINGPLRSMLSAERVMLNFLQRLSGIATLTSQYVQAVEGTKAMICDTRKTTPGWRGLEKYAVRCGGGKNHRYGLYDACMIKDNHLAALDGKNRTKLLRQAIRMLQKQDRRPDFVQVEVDTLEQLAEILPIEGIDIILLDNMTPEQMRQAVALRDQRAKHITLEASGGVTLQTVCAIAETGVERISAGALTHSARCLDISLEIA